LSIFKTENVRNVKPEIITEDGKSYLNLEFQCDNYTGKYTECESLNGELYKIDLQTLKFTKDNTGVMFELGIGDNGNLAKYNYIE
jgi:hypothetical protein